MQWEWATRVPWHVSPPIGVPTSSCWWA
uniref:Uncharacterized protein n=1 Tax=Ciona savignyi TaxID=51511 RepID=H2Z5A2_CIOSA